MKVEFDWLGRMAKGPPNARMRKMYGVTNQAVTTLYTYRIEGRVHYRLPRSKGSTLKVLKNDSFHAVFTTRDEAVAHANPGKRRKGWWVNHLGEINECRVTKDGYVYDLEGRRLARRKDGIHRSEAAAVREAVRMLRDRAATEAASVKSLRARIRRLEKSG